MKAVLIDHDDSFTFNLRHWLLSFTNEVEIINHADILKQNFTATDFVVLSPGPKSPYDYPHIISWLKENYFVGPILGVCLGMQLLTVATGGVVSVYSPPRHGKKSKLITNMPGFNNLEVARYHSLQCLQFSEFELIAESESIPMWIEHKNKKWLGFQFHPESFLTENTIHFQNYINQWAKS